MIKGLRLSLRMKWMAFSILLATLPLGTAGVSVIRTYQEDLRSLAIEVESEKARFVAESTRAFFEKVRETLLFLSKETDFQRADHSELRESFKKVLSENDYLIGLRLLDEKGGQVASLSKLGPMELSKKKDYSRTEMFLVASRGRIYHGGFDLIKNKQPTMIVAVPVQTDSSKVHGVLTAQIHLQSIWDVVASLRIGKKGFAFIVDREGTLIFHPDTERVVKRINMGHLPMVSEVVAGREGNMELEDPLGERILYAYKPIKGLRWGVVAQIPIEEIYQPIRVATRKALMWICLSVLVAITFTFLLTKRLVQPIRQLSDEMAKVSRGDLSARLEWGGRDEIALLAGSFNRMVQELKQSQEALIETERKYRRIFENSKDMVYITTVDGRFVDINQAGVEMLGYRNKKDLMNISIRDLCFDQEERKKFQNEIGQKGFVKDFEVRLKKRDGTPIDCLITANIRKEEEGIIIGYEGIIKDISFRKNAEKQLIQKTEQLQTLYDLSLLINESLDMEKILHLVLDKALSITGFEMGTIHLLDDDGSRLDLRAHSGFSPAFIEQVKVLRWSEGVTGRAVEQKRPVITPIEEYPYHRILPFLREEGVRLTVGVPLMSKGKAIGAIVLSSRTTSALGPKEIGLLESLGAQMGLALENARLFSHVAKAKSEWETTFDAVTDLLTIRDKDYRIIRANKAAFQRYRLTPAEMIGKRCFELLHQKDSPCEACYVSETLRTQRPVSGERESLYLKGVFEYYTFPVWSESGEIVAVIDLAREVTEEKKRQSEKEAVHRINRIMTSSLDVREATKAIHSEIKTVLGSEKMTITLLVNGDRFRYFASEDDEAQGWLRSESYPKEGTPLAKAVETGQPVIVSDTSESDSWVDRQFFGEGIRSSLVFPLEYKQRVIGTINFGSRKPGHFSEDHIRFLQQVSIGLASSIQNALLLDEIRASEEKYRTVVERAMDGICVIGEDGRFSYVNQRLAEILGYPQEELIGMDSQNCLDEKGKRIFSDRNTRRMRGEKVPRFFEFSILRKDQEIRDVECSTKAVKDSNGRVHYVVILKDITEKKKMEGELLQNEKLRALGEMASGVAHDFNNALASILGNVQLLLHTARDKDKDLVETLQTIEKVAKDSAQTVRRLQDFTRKKTAPEFFRVDVPSVVRDAIEITRPKWKDHPQKSGVQIEVVTSFEEVPPVKGNPSELREVVTNLIFNAVEAMPEGGKIEIRTYARDKKVYIQVGDSGIGMTEEVKKKAFEPFFTTKPFTNTGLGLSMSYGIIKRLEGEIEVESDVGKGTTITLVLPVRLEGDELEPPTLLPTRTAREARILVIDDEEAVRSVLSRILSQMNHQVTVAKDGQEGVQLFQEKEFDLVLTDLGMPGMSGWDVCKAIKKLRARVPVGMITGWGMELDQTKKEGCSPDFVLPKPFDFREILQVIDEMIQWKDKGSTSLEALGTESDVWGPTTLR